MPSPKPDTTFSPLVPGHEIVGRVIVFGSEVTRRQVDDCLKGHTLVFGSPDPVEPGAHTQGGHSEAIVAPLRTPTRGIQVRKEPECMIP
ncbi:hypothetical protein [Streptomyces hyaluromycini]|uniref:hypothetical protein n=1 Tax=Streptomyces hyaluromycini TaxID=1377993 RepID=UPI000B5CFA7B|nr:hypothetical protein [Streptomyces hyaluromycini]